MEEYPFPINSLLLTANRGKAGLFLSFPTIIPLPNPLYIVFCIISTLYIVFFWIYCPFSNPLSRSTTHSFHIWLETIDTVLVHRNSQLTFRFHNGSEIRI
jgi:hypothetical protein